MKGDLHHLFACEMGCKSFRGNTPYFDFTDYEEKIRDACGKREEARFEPSAGKGEVARATLYYFLRYPNMMREAGGGYDKARLNMILQWHKDHKVTPYEKHRNMAIFEMQGNRNPFIDFPDWASKVDFLLGL
jgi:endonuclease I